MDFTTDSFFHKYECAADAADSQLSAAPFP